MMHPYAVTLLCIGLIGFVSTGAQLAIIEKLQDKFIVRAQSSYNRIESHLSQALAASTSGKLCECFFLFIVLSNKSQLIRRTMQSLS